MILRLYRYISRQENNALRKYFLKWGKGFLNKESGRKEIRRLNYSKRAAKPLP